MIPKLKIELELWYYPSVSSNFNENYKLSENNN